MTTRYLAEFRRPLLVAGAAAVVGVARIVHGVHLPADVVGGWSFGVLMGLAGLWLAGSLSTASPARDAGGPDSRRHRGDPNPGVAP